MTRTSLGLAAAMLLGACSGSDDKEDTGTDPGTTTETCESEVFFRDGNNYSFTSSFQLSEVEVPAQSDFVIDWSGLTEDIRGREVDPTTIDQISLVEFNLTKDEVVAGIDSNSFEQSDAESQLLFSNDGGATQLNVADLDALGNPIDLAWLDENPEQTWLLSASNNLDGRPMDFLMNVFLKPTEGSTTTVVYLDNDSSTLEFDVDLQSADALCAPAGDPDVLLDWTEITNDAYDRPLDLNFVNNLVIGHVPQDDLGAVEDIFLRLYDEADQLYQLNVNGFDFAYLNEAESDDGTPFPGFSTDGTWVVAIECLKSECTNPAPILLAVVEAK